MVKDTKDKSRLALAINGQLIGEWFKEQFGRLFSSMRRIAEPHNQVRNNADGKVASLCFGRPELLTILPLDKFTDMTGKPETLPYYSKDHNFFY